MQGTMKLQTLMSIFLGRRNLVFWIFFLVATGGTALNFWIPKQYTSSTTVLLDTKSANPTSANTAGEVGEQRFLREQVAVIASFSTALRVVDSLGLDKTTEGRQMYNREEAALGNLSTLPLKSWLADALLKKLKVHAAADGNLVEVEFTSSDARLAASIANTFVQTYVKAVADGQSNSAKYQIQFAQRQLADLREGMSNVEKNIYELQQSETYFAIDERFDVENKRLQDLRSRVVSTVSTNETALAQLRTDYEMQKNRVSEINALRAKLKAQQSNLEAMRRSYDFAMQRVWQGSFDERPSTFSVTVLRVAQASSSPSLPKLWINLPLCFLIGAILAMASALVAELFDRRIRSEADAAELLGLPVLASVNL